MRAEERRSLKVALTFDDGPRRSTLEILDQLARHGAHATFFVVGKHIRGREDILRRAVAEGHELGNHSDTHPHLSLLSDDEIAAELQRANERIRAATGTTPRLLRPPFGDDAPRVAAVAAGLGFAVTVLWSVDPRDWEEPPAEEVARRVLAHTFPGAIVLLHHYAVTLGALGTMLPCLRGRGYELTTVSELLSDGAPAPEPFIPVRAWPPQP